MWIDSGIVLIGFLFSFLIKIFGKIGPDIFFKIIPILLITLLINKLPNQVMLIGAKFPQKYPQTCHINMANLIKIPRHLLQTMLINPHQHINPPIPNLQTGNMRQEIITNEKTQENEVVDHFL